MTKVGLTANILKSFACTKLFEHDKHINSIDFSLDGRTLVSCNADEQITIYDSYLGVPRPEKHFSRKYGIGLVRFADRSHKVVHTSTKLNHDVRLLDLRQNNYIAYYTGHTGKVISMSTAINCNAVITGAQDKSVRIWDVRSPNCQGLIYMAATPIVSFDPEGKLFAAITLSSSLALYDMRSFDKAPFLLTKHNQESLCDWTGLQFSPDQKYLLVNTNGSILRLLDAFNGAPKHVFQRYTNDLGMNLEPCFTPDAAYIICGSTDGALHIWQTDSGRRICKTFKDRHQPQVISYVKFSPSLMMLATAGDAMTFWSPKVY